MVVLLSGVETKLRKTWSALERTPIGLSKSEGWDFTRLALFVFLPLTLVLRFGRRILTAVERSFRLVRTVRWVFLTWRQARAGLKPFLAKAIRKFPRPGLRNGSDAPITEMDARDSQLNRGSSDDYEQLRPSADQPELVDRRP
jgi:hypothetical protein